MIFLMFLMGLGLLGVAVRLAIHAAVLPRIRISLHLRSIEGYGFETGKIARGLEPRLKLNAAIAEHAERLGRFAMARLPMLAPLKRGELAAAGYYESSPETVHGYRALGASVLPALILLYMVTTGHVSMLLIVMLLIAAFGGWQLPAMTIRRRGSSRLENIDRELPDLIDLLTATIESGMSLAGSLGLLANRFKGPLGEELRLTLQQQTLGISMEQALNDMAERCDTTSMRAFVRTVTRGESLGVSIGPILRELAADTRRRRRMAAKEKMQKAPVKMLFPLILLIFPALMIELLLPAGFALLKSLGSG
jgi:tight adherence protein C